MTPAEDSKLEVIIDAAAQLREQIHQPDSELVAQLPPKWQSKELVQSMRAEGIEVRFTGEPIIGTERCLASAGRSNPEEAIELTS